MEMSVAGLVIVIFTVTKEVSPFCREVGTKTTLPCALKILLEKLATSLDSPIQIKFS